MQSQRRGLIQTLFLMYEKLFGWKLCAIVVAGLLVVLLACATLPWESDSERDITLVFRYDDFCEVSPLEVEQEILRIFAEFEYPVSFGVIPDHCDSHARRGQESGPPKGNLLSQERADAVQWAVDAGVMRVALHGYAHRPHIDGQTGNEFAGLPADTQRELIVKGKTLLEERFGVPIDTFIPPFNSYDRETVRVLEEEGFRLLSASVRDGPAVDSHLAYLPVMGDWLDVHQAVNTARRFSSRSIIVLYAHPFDFAAPPSPLHSFQLDRLRAQLAWVQKQPDVEVVSMDDVDDAYDLSAARIQRHYPLFAQRSLIGPWLGSMLGLRPRHLDLTDAPPVALIRTMQFGAMAAFVLLLFTLATFFAWLVARMWSASAALSVGLAGVGALLMVAGALGIGTGIFSRVLETEIRAYLFAVGAGLIFASSLEVLLKQTGNKPLRQAS